MTNDLSDNKKPTRESNFELLRIVAMFMIVAHHLAVHGVQHMRDSTNAFVVYNAGTLANKLFASFLTPGGGVGVAVFFMITGYFLCEKTRTSIMKVSLQTAFYGIFMSLVLVVSIFLHSQFGRGYAFKELGLDTKIQLVLKYIFIPVTGGASWWFVAAYAVLVLLAPRLNNCIAPFTKSQFLRFLAVSWFFWYSCQYVLSGAYYAFARAYFFYLLGAYFKKFGIQSRDDGISMPNRLFLPAMLFVFCWSAMALLSFASPHLSGNGTKTVSIALKKALLSGMSICVFLPFCAAGLFCFFKNLRMPSSRVVNGLAATTFGIYLIHDSSVSRLLLWNVFFSASENAFSSVFFPVIAIGQVLAVFFVCAAIDWLRSIFIEPHMLKFANKACWM